MRSLTEVAWGIQQCAIERGLATTAKRTIAMIGVDEMAIAKGQRYKTVVCDPKRGIVEYIVDERRAPYLDGFYEGLEVGNQTLVGSEYVGLYREEIVPDKDWARKHWKRWDFWATHSRLKPVIDAAQLLKRHVENVLTYFDHGITNAVSQGLNSKIQTIKKLACGFRNKANVKTAVFFHCGGGKSLSATHGNPG